MKTTKTVGLLIGNLLAAVLIGTLLLLAVFALPTSQTHAAQSAELMAKEGCYPELTNIWFSRLDNWTDSIMLMEASDTTDDTLLHRAMLVPHGSFGEESEVSPFDAFQRHELGGEAYTGSVTYARYWHGYLVFLKPLLLVTDYSGIRIVNGAALLLVTAIALWMLWKRDLKVCVAPFAIAALMMMPAVLAKSLQISVCYYLLTLGVIAMAAIPAEKLDTLTPFLFLNLGIAVAYFDFLTYPVAVFGVPAVVLTVRKTDKPLKDRILRLVLAGLCWGFGFAGMWGSKWILSSLLTEENVIADAFAMILHRTSGSDVHYGVFSTLQMNLYAFLKNPVSAVLLLTGGYWSIALFQKDSRKFSDSVQILIPFVLLALMPFVWYLIARNHSWIHFFFTNKLLVVTVFAALCGLNAARLQK